MPPGGLKGGPAEATKVTVNTGGRLGSLGTLHSVMILPQVHLRKPCYDFYVLYMTGFDQLSGPGGSLPTLLGQSEGLTEPFNR